jgi:hypothetical protein|tara:strand:- start:643 stop:867 length:225 start_codon:yes stop_codon:yes gene_type:complete
MMTASDFQDIADVLIKNTDVYEDECFMNGLYEVLGNSKYFDKDNFDKYITAGIEKDDAEIALYPTDEMVRKIEG